MNVIDAFGVSYNLEKKIGEGSQGETFILEGGRYIAKLFKKTSNNTELKSLKGVEYLTELTKIQVYGCSYLSYMDLSKNTKLYHLEFDGTKVSVLDLTNVPAFDNILSVKPVINKDYTGGDGIKYDYMVFTDGNTKLYICEGNTVITKNAAYNYETGLIEKPNTWLEPLKTQLHIASDTEFGGNVNYTAEYTSNFSLPVEILQYLKDHPNTTLIYTYMKDELNSVTVKIPGKDVVLQDGVEWYGIDNLVKTYGVYKK